MLSGSEFFALPLNLEHFNGPLEELVYLLLRDFLHFDKLPE